VPDGFVLPPGLVCQDAQTDVRDEIVRRGHQDAVENIGGV